MAYEANCCPKCGQYDTLVELPREKRHVTWAEHDGRVIEVDQYRCLSCGASDLIQRDTSRRHEKHEPQPGQASPMDGRMFSAAPIADEEV